MKILVLKGGVSTEREVSLESGRMVFENLDREKYSPIEVLITKDGDWIFDEDHKMGLWDSIKYLQSLKIDLVFLALHGKFGEDGQIQAHFDRFGIHYTGSSAGASRLAMDKAKTNERLKKEGFLVPKSRLYREIPGKIGLELPVVVKPKNGGSSIATTIVKNVEELGSAFVEALKVADEVLVEEFIAGREFTIPVIENHCGELTVLPVIEIKPKISEFFDYKAKYEDDGSEEIINPDLSQSETEEIQNLALKVHKSLGLSGYSRSDFIEKDGNFYFIEINALPGLTKNSLLPKSARAAGYDFPKILDLIIDSAFRK